MLKKKQVTKLVFRYNKTVQTTETGDVQNQHEIVRDPAWRRYGTMKCNLEFKLKRIFIKDRERREGLRKRKTPGGCPGNFCVDK